MVRTTKVSMNTPTMATTPWSWGMLDLCHGVGVRGRTHTGLIGEQAALDALADGGLQGVAQAAADDGVGEEGILEDHADGLRQIGQAQDEQDQPADQIQNGHDGHELFRDSGHAVHAAEEDDRGQDRNARCR